MQQLWRTSKSPFFWLSWEIPTQRWVLSYCLWSTPECCSWVQQICPHSEVLFNFKFTWKVSNFPLQNMSQQGKSGLAGNGYNRWVHQPIFPSNGCSYLRPVGRWFDKGLTLENFLNCTKGACNMEHSGADATVSIFVLTASLQMILSHALLCSTSVSCGSTACRKKSMVQMVTSSSSEGRSVAHCLHQPGEGTNSSSRFEDGLRQHFFLGLAG